MKRYEMKRNKERMGDAMLMLLTSAGMTNEAHKTEGGSTRPPQTPHETREKMKTKSEKQKIENDGWKE